MVRHSGSLAYTTFIMELEMTASTASITNAGVPCGIKVDLTPISRLTPTLVGNVCSRLVLGGVIYDHYRAS